MDHFMSMVNCYPSDKFLDTLGGIQCRTTVPRALFGHGTVWQLASPRRQDIGSMSLSKCSLCCRRSDQQLSTRCSRSTIPRPQLAYKWDFRDGRSDMRVITLVSRLTDIFSAPSLHEQSALGLTASNIEWYVTLPLPCSDFI